MNPTTCPFCHFALLETFYFCPNCGKKLSDPPITTLKEISVYIISILLPPLGLWPGIKYLFSKNGRTKRAGMIAIALTIFSTIITLWLSIALFNNLSKSVNSQLNQYQNLGY
jgi:uncharacterized membrane protein YqaE (UPF0057 family)